MPAWRDSTLGTPIQEMDVFVVNLKSREDRRFHALKESKKYELSVKFVEAVESGSIDPANLGFLTAPALACWKSHLKAFNLVANSKNHMCLILEDDFEFKDFHKIQRILRNIDLKDWDIIQIGFLTHDFKEWISIKLQNLEFLLFALIARLSTKIWLENEGLNKKLRVRRAKNVPLSFVPDDLRAGAHAYIIGEKCARDMIMEHSEQRVLTSDGLLIATNWTKPYKTLRLRKSLVRQISSKSSIKGYQ